MIYTTRNDCRLCNGTLTDVVSLGDIYMSTFITPGDPPPPKVPIILTACDTCNLVQLRHTVNQDMLYKDYWYESGINASMVIALKDVVDAVRRHVVLQPGDIVVDIGSNDGTLLSHYGADFIKVGFEPSNVANDLPTPNQIIHDYFSAKSYFQHFWPKAKVITAIAMFYDLEDPHAFVTDLKNVLHNDGILVIQMMDLLSMFRYADFPNLCSEHLEYYSLEILNDLLLGHGLEIFDVEYNGVNGGSLRVYARHLRGTNLVPEVLSAIRDERVFFEMLGDPFAYFKNRIESTKAAVVDCIRSYNESGKKVAALGASTKGNTTLQYFGLTHDDIICIADANEDKWGKITPGSTIPILSDDAVFMLKPDLMLILPWGFIQFFLEKYRPYLETGGRFLVPLPQPRIIGITSGELTTEYL